MGVSEDMVHIQGDLQRRLQSLEDSVSELRRNAGQLGFSRLANGTLLIPGGITIGGGNGGGAGTVLAPVIPAAPVVTATAGADATSSWIDLTWTYPVGLNATTLQSFEVQWQRTGDVGWQATNTTLLSIRIPVAPGVTYNWRVRYITILGLVGTFFAGSTLTLNDTGVPSKTLGVTLTPGFRTSLVRWTDAIEVDVAKGAGYYMVRLDPSPKMNGGGGAYPNNVAFRQGQTAGTIIGFSGLNTSTPYYVEVAAVDASGNQGPWSSLVFARTTAGVNLTMSGAARTITRNTGSWVTDGVLAGDVIDLPAPFAGEYIILTVTATVLTLAVGEVIGTGGVTNALWQVRRPVVATTQQVAGSGVGGTDIAADAITAFEIAANSITANELSATIALIGKAIQSANWAAGVAGWRIWHDGVNSFAEFNAGVVTINGGSLVAATITGTSSITGAVITGGTILTNNGGTRVALEGAGNRIALYVGGAQSGMIQPSSVNGGIDMLSGNGNAALQLWGNTGRVFATQFSMDSQLLLNQNVTQQGGGYYANDISLRGTTIWLFDSSSDQWIAQRINYGGQTINGPVMQGFAGAALATSTGLRLWVTTSSVRANLFAGGASNPVYYSGFDIYYVPSSIETKRDLRPIEEWVDTSKIYELPVLAFERQEHMLTEGHLFPDHPEIGLVAEDAEALWPGQGFTARAGPLDLPGIVWEYINVAMLRELQKLHARVEVLEARSN